MKLEELQQKIQELKPEPLNSNIGKKTIVIANITFWKGIIIGFFITLIILCLFIVTHVWSFGFKVEFTDVITVFSTCILVITALYAAKAFQLTIDSTERQLKFESDKFILEAQIKIDENNNRVYLEKQKLSDENIERKKVHSYYYINGYLNPQMAHAMQRAKMFAKYDPLFKKLKSLSPHSDELKEWAVEFDKHQDREYVMLILNYLENMGQGIKSDFLDEEIIKDFIYVIAVNYYHDYMPYIEFRQKENAQILENLVFYAKRWTHV